MKRVLPLLIWCGIIIPGLAQQTYSSLTFEPARPEPGEKIEVTYDPTGTPLAGAEEIEAVAFLYNGTSYTAQDLHLSRAGSVLKATVKTEPATDGVVFSFRSEGLQDDNRQQGGYFTYLHDRQGQPVAGARGGLAAMYVDWGGYLLGLDRNPVLAARLLEGELTAYPASEGAFLHTSLVLLAGQDKEKSPEAVLHKLDAVARKQHLGNEELAVLADWYGRYKQEEKAEKYKARALQKAPKGELAERTSFMKSYEEKDRSKKIALLTQFEQDFPKSPQLSYLYSTIAGTFVEEQDFAGLRKFVQMYGKRIPHGAYNAIARKLYEADKEPALAEDLAAQGVTKARRELAQPSGEQPDHLGEKGWKSSRESSLGTVLDTYAAILSKQGKTEEAYAALKEAVALQKGRNAEVNERYVALLVKTNRHKEAMAAGDRFIPDGKGTRQMKEDLRLAYITVNGNEKGYDRYLASLEAPAREKMKKELATKMISEPAPAFSLQDLEGNTVSLADLKGKTIVVDFWATWCGPCIASMPAMQQAVNKYKDDPDVKFLFINSWQNEPDKQQVVGGFLEKKNYDFTVPLDTDNKVISAYKVDGIPTKFVIDPQGNIRFKSVGFGGGPDALVEELGMMIDMAAGKNQ